MPEFWAIARPAYGLNRSATLQAARHLPDSNKVYCVVLTTTATAEEADKLARP